MRRMRTCCVAVVGCLAIFAAACSAGVEDAASSTDTGPAATAADAISAVDDSRQDPDDSGIRVGDKPYWEVDSREALDTLFRGAEGHASYYIFDPVPGGLALGRASLDVEGTYCSMRFDGEDDHLVKMFVFSLEEMGEDRSGLTEIEVDGRTYYYQQSLDDNGECYVSYFEWTEDDKIMLVHPGEPITPDVIRKYSQVKKVEFNVGQREVGLGTGVPLIADLNKKKALIRAHQGIHYHTGEVSPGKHDDLLEP